MQPDGAGDPVHRVVGRIGKPHGVGGEVTVDVRTDAPDERFVIGAQLAAGEGRALTVASVRPHREKLLIRFDGVDDRGAAETLRGTVLTVDVRRLPPTGDPDEFHDHELEGLLAVDPAGSMLGTVREVLHGPGADLLAVDTGAAEVLVPFVREIVPDVDVASRRLVIDPPQGLFDAD